MLIIRNGSTADLQQSAHLLNDIISIGGTTARVEQTTAEALGQWLFSNPSQATWFVAENESGNLLGFQWIGPHQNLPSEACDISTFVKPGQTGLGIGSKLFNATMQAAIDLDYEWINASIRADNEGGLIYYQSRGFRDWGRLENFELADGTKTDKILKRFDLKD